MIREFVVGKHALEAAHDRDMTLAWTIETLRRHKRVPTLKTLLTRRESVRQTTAQLKAGLQLISETYQIPLRKVKKKKR